MNPPPESAGWTGPWRAPRPPTARSAGPAVAVAATVLFAIAFIPASRLGWVNWDDPVNVLANPLLANGSAAVSTEAWRAGYRGLYIPVSYSLFGVEAAAARWLRGTPPGSPPPPLLFHLVSIVLHAGCVFLVWRLLARLVADPTAAAIGAMLFAVHPLQVESVAWVSEQRGLLAALLGLAALDAWHEWWSRGAPLSPGSAVCGTLCFMAALLAKPSAMVMPALMAVLAVLHGGLPPRRVAAALSPWFGLAAAAAIVTKSLQPVAPGVAPPVADRLLVAGDALAFYACKLIVPLRLCVDYGRTPAVALADPLVPVRAAAAAAGTAAVFLLPAARPLRLPVALWLVPLTPVLGFVPFLFQGISTVGDRYAYLALLGPAAALAAGLAARPRRRLLLAAAWAGLFLAAVLSADQAKTWTDSRSLNVRAMGVNGGTRDTANNLGLALLEAGDYQPAVACFRRAVLRDPSFAKARYNLGLALQGMGLVTEAEESYRSALAICPSYAAAHNNLGILLAGAGRLDAAAKHFREAARLGESDATRNLHLLERTAGGQPP